MSDSLLAFLGTPAFEALGGPECRRLQRQEWIMAQYLQVLGERLAAWTQDATAGPTWPCWVSKVTPELIGADNHGAETGFCTARKVSENSG